MVVVDTDVPQGSGVPSPQAGDAMRKGVHRGSRTPGVAPSLTRDQIAATALALGDEIGIENVSARKLAARLDKTPMALYTYFDSLDDIRVAALARAFREVDANPVPGERWDDTLRRTMASIRAMYLRHRRCNLWKVESNGYSAGLAEHTRRIYRLHEDQGIPPTTLRRLWRVVDAFLGGFIPAEIASLADESPRPDPTGQAWMETAEGAYGEQAFFDGIDLIVAGVRALSAPDPCDWRTPSASATATAPTAPTAG